MNESQYEMIIYWSQPDRAFLVEVPEFFGVTPSKSLIFIP
jgi:predicted RNase H-like HicB family nuclease